MSKDIHLAFAHPAERSAATQGAELRDRISLRDHTVEVEIGAFQSERGTTQRICFNIVVELLPQTGPVDDDVDRILSYDTLTEAIAFELAAERLNLLETLAERVAERILLAPQAMRVFVRIEKLDRGPGALGVEIVRARKEPPLRPVKPAPVPVAAGARVVYLGNAVLASSALTQWLDALEASDLPAVLCVGAGDMPAPAAAAPAAQRRIDLLAIEQNAWVLAGRDPRCVVVGTRTELDHAIKTGEISVWAPSKIVLDAVDGPGISPRDADQLAYWLAGQIQAAECLFIGDGRAPEGAIPQRRLGLGAFADL
ncbi:bifunctional dihydroneopterin aldolase/dihydroneopterin triphosphate 2'-epimerase [Pseudoruegeria aquimaris]|uniref:dihydroneopterin aldolase n=1 Tax=Pseudoruegeria aquimaris TaxID=393663 RepID=A0A1Y5SIE2_9RHOB|nr:dihydroneopterin aldolase [Pseudoruegeria aquimaris]SLN41212.1 bifunctional dihydroneopterin aldolase/dihydroneopterin triphosphate 2'-epimerase [Pseudoruegeria aquimaris]